MVVYYCILYNMVIEGILSNIDTLMMQLLLDIDHINYVPLDGCKDVNEHCIFVLKNATAIDIEIKLQGYEISRINQPNLLE